MKSSWIRVTETAKLFTVKQGRSVDSQMVDHRLQIVGLKGKTPRQRPKNRQPFKKLRTASKAQKPSPVRLISVEEYYRSKQGDTRG